MDQIYFDSMDAPPDLSPTIDDTNQANPTHLLHDRSLASPLIGRDPFTSSHRRRGPCSNLEARVSELESENLRLHRLVAELLMKNQRLRKLEQSE